MITVYFQTRYWRTWSRLRPTSLSDPCSCLRRRRTPSPPEDTPTRMCRFHLQSLLRPQPRLWTAPWSISRTPPTPLSRYVSEGSPYTNTSSYLQFWTLTVREMCNNNRPSNSNPVFVFFSPCFLNLTSLVWLLFYLLSVLILFCQSTL